MADKTHTPRHKIGAYETMAISDGVLHASYDPFRNIERGDAVKLVGRPDTGAGSVPIEVNAFYINLNGKHVMIDVGSSNTMGPTLGHLPKNLRAAGIEPHKIDYVLLTHIHPDHANGLVDENDKPYFPNAEIIVHERDARFWLDREPDERDADFVRRNNSAARRVFGPYERVTRVRDGEVLPGVTAFIQTGHSPGHTGYLVQNGGDAMLFWGDIIHVAAIQLAHPGATLIYDLDQDAAAVSRKRVLDWVATDRIRVAGAHMDMPCFGHITRRGTGFAFEPAA